MFATIYLSNKRLTTKIFFPLFTAARVGFLLLRLPDSLKRMDDNNSLPFIFDLSQSQQLVLISKKEDVQILRSFVEKGSDEERITFIGIDTETLPYSLLRKRKQKHQHHQSKSKTALLQIALRKSRLHEATSLECVFVIDLYQLNLIGDEGEGMNCLDQVLTPLLASENCIKFGQSIKQDLKELHVSYPKMISFSVINRVLDVNVLLRFIDVGVGGNGGSKQTIGLKAITMQFLNLNLVKKQQCSDWERRPLTLAQIHYAACDALVLMRVFDVMCCEIEGQQQQHPHSSSSSSSSSSSKSALLTLSQYFNFIPTELFCDYTSASFESSPRTPLVSSPSSFSLPSSASETSLSTLNNEDKDEKKHSLRERGRAEDEEGEKDEEVEEEEEARVDSDRGKCKGKGKGKGSFSINKLALLAPLAAHNFRSWRSDASRAWIGTTMREESLTSAASEVSEEDVGEEGQEREEGFAVGRRICKKSKKCQGTDGTKDIFLTLPIPIAQGKHTYFFSSSSN